MSVQPQNPYAPSTVQDYGNVSQGTSGNLATLSQRLIGAIIDALIMLPIAFVMGMILGVILIAVGIGPDNAMYNLLLTVFGAVIGMGLFLVLNGYLLATRGQTIGKVVAKTRIVAEDGSLVPFGPLILKRYVPVWVVSQIPLIGGVLALLNVLMIFRENRKCLHDDIAGTKVIAE